MVRRNNNGVDQVLDVRVNQRQVDLDGQQLGINRPDLQYTLNGKRYYVEWDRPRCSDPTRTLRGDAHFQRILTNANTEIDDPFGQVQVLIAGACE